MVASGTPAKRRCFMVTRTELALAAVLILCTSGVVYGQIDRASLNGTVLRVES